MKDKMGHHDEYVQKLKETFCKGLPLIIAIGLMLLASPMLPDEAHSQEPWYDIGIKDEFGEVVRHAAWSDWVSPISNSTGWGSMMIGYFCGEDFLTVRGLNRGTLPLQNYTTTSSTGKRWYEDEAVVRGASGEYRVAIFYGSGDNDIHVRKGKSELFADVLSGSTIAISFPTPNLRVAYRWSLRGSTAAIRDACG